MISEVGAMGFLRNVKMEFNQVQVNDGSIDESLEGAKCLVT